MDCPMLQGHLQVSDDATEEGLKEAIERCGSRVLERHPDYSRYEVGHRQPEYANGCWFFTLRYYR